jgi:hypothetical protein
LKVKDIKTIEELPKLTEKTLGERKKWDGEEEEGMWNKKSILWELEYWPMLDVRHWIDNIHAKKNVWNYLWNIATTEVQRKRS